MKIKVRELPTFPEHPAIRQRKALTKLAEKKHPYLKSVVKKLRAFYQ